MPSILNTAHEFATEVVTEAATAEIACWVGAVSIVVIAASWVVPHRFGGTPEGNAIRMAWAVGRFAAVLAMFAVVTAQVVSSGWLTGADTVTLSWFAAHRGATVTAAALAITTAGGPAGVVVIAMLIAAVIAWRRRRAAPAVLVVAVVAVAASASTLTKIAVRRGRPPAAMQLTAEQDFSYPSGHVTATAALAGAVVLVYLLTRPGPVRTVAATAGAACVVAVVASTRLYLGVHWVSDVLGGALLGSTVVAAAACVTTALPGLFDAATDAAAPMAAAATTEASGRRQVPMTLRHRAERPALH